MSTLRIATRSFVEKAPAGISIEVDGNAPRALLTFQFAAGPRKSWACECV